MPCPDGLEAVEEGNVLPQVGEQPQTGCVGEVGDAEENDTEDGHEEEETQQAEETPGEVVDALAQLEGPERVADDEEDDEQGDGGVNLAHHLAALVQPDVVHILLGLLLGLDLDSPQALDPLGLLVVVAGVGVDLGDAQGEHRHGQKLEGVLEGCKVEDLGQDGVLLSRLFVGGRLESAEGSLDCWGLLLASCFATRRLCHHTSEHVLALAVQDASTRLKLLAAQEVGQSDGLGVRGTRDNRLRAWGRASLLALRRHRAHLATGRRSLTLTLRLGAHGGHPVGLSLRLELLDELGDGHAGLLGISLELTAHGLDLLGGRLLARLGETLGRALRGALARRRRHRHVGEG